MVSASEMKKMKGFIRENPTSADEIHCVLYVIRATSSLTTSVSTSFKEIKTFRDSRTNEGMCFVQVIDKKKT